MRYLLLAALVAGLGAGCGSTRTVVRTVTVKGPASTADQRFYGQVVSLTRSGDGYLLRFDPSWWLGGVTANVAAAEDNHVSCAPRACNPVANDYYTIDESHRALTFLLPRGTQGTVLTSGSNLTGTRIGADQLAQIVAGTGPKLFEPLESGVWIDVHIDTVRSFAQQYRP
jgi:hypothetical protein